MSWQDRDYAQGGGYTPGPGTGGVRSWLGGLPPAGRAVKAILLANIAMFVLCLITGGGGSPVYDWFEMRTDLVWRGQIWRLFTFTYLHSPDGLGHIFWNMLGLYFLGGPVERRWGARQFFQFYTAGGFAAVLLYFVLTTAGWLNPHVPLVGASGNVLAVLGVCAVLFPSFQIILVFFFVPIRLAAIIFVIGFVFNLTSRGANAGGDACHLAGLAFGVYWGYRGGVWTGKWQQARERARQGAWEAKRREALLLERRVDAILEKVKEHGIGSLTRSEKKTLEEATKRQQMEDRRHGL